MKTYEELGIFWATADGHIEVTGITFYGFWNRLPLPEGIGFVTEFWKHISAEIAAQQIHTDDGNHLIVSVWVKQWPCDDTWRNAVVGMLNAMVANGAIVSWCGGECCSWSLSELDPMTSAGCIYAASSAHSGVIFHSELSEDIAYLTDNELLKLQAALRAD